MATLRDGLGGEELTQSGLQAGATNISPYFTGSLTSESQISGLNLFGTGSVHGGIVRDSDGAINTIRNISGPAGGFGARIETGSCVTTATGFGSAIFNRNFTDARYYWNAQASSGGTFLAINAGSIVPMVSGILGLNISGITFHGAPSTPYSWVAIGR